MAVICLAERFTYLNSSSFRCFLFLIVGFFYFFKPEHLFGKHFGGDLVW